MQTSHFLLFYAEKAKEIGEVCMQARGDFSSNEGEIMHYIAMRLDRNLRTIENITNVDSFLLTFRVLKYPLCRE